MKQYFLPRTNTNQHEHREKLSKYEFVSVRVVRGRIKKGIVDG